METQEQYPRNDYAEQINLAHQVIDLPVRKAQMLFKDLDLCTITYLKNDVSVITLEVLFETATLTCLFDNDDICKSVYLSLEDNETMMRYISHCAKEYTYDFLLNGWITGKCHISLCNIEDKGCAIMILPLRRDF